MFIICFRVTCKLFIQLEKNGGNCTEFQITYCVCGYVYHDIWDASLGETLECEREPTNEKDRYAVAVKKLGTIVGYAQKNISN